MDSFECVYAAIVDCLDDYDELVRRSALSYVDLGYIAAYCKNACHAMASHDIFNENYDIVVGSLLVHPGLDSRMYYLTDYENLYFELNYMSVRDLLVRFKAAIVGDDFDDYKVFDFMRDYRTLCYYLHHLVEVTNTFFSDVKIFRKEVLNETC